MDAPDADVAIELTAAASAATVAFNNPKLNARTGLSTDYLNHFTEAVMVLEMLTTMPECVDDLLAWRPKTYREHFAGSRFADRDEIIAAYEAAPHDIRESLDSAAETLNAVLAETRTVVIQHIQTPMAEVLAQRALGWLKPLIARTAAVINGAVPRATGLSESQAAIDDLFSR